jgi:4-hydroxybenzoate polyprenyltransferase
VLKGALKILVDVAQYRLRRLEMANLGGAVSIMIALRLAPGDIAIRTLFAFLLNLLAYLTNDYCDIDHDLASGRAAAKTRYLAENRKAALLAQIVLIGVLAVIALVHSPGLLLALVLGEGLCFLYSSKLKRVAYADVVVMAVCGGAMALVAVPLDRTLGFLLVAQLGLFSGCFELIQVLRDREEDSKTGVRTTAVALGERGTLWFLRGLMLIAAVFATSLLGRYSGPVILLAALLPHDPNDVKRYWNWVRLVFGVAWLGIIVGIVLGGAPSGILS